MTPLLSFTLLVAITAGIVQVAKKAKAPKRLLPLIALGVGLAVTLVGDWTNITNLSILSGLAVGLSSVGLFEHTKLLKKDGR